MRKTVLMLILCAPLFWTAWLESRRLYDVLTRSQASTRKTDDPEHDRAVKTREKIKKDADAIVNLPDDVAATIVRLDPPLPGFGKAGGDTSGLQQRLVSAVRDHVIDRGHDRKMIEEKRLGVTGLENNIKDALEGVRDRDKPESQRKEALEGLDKLLKVYKDQDLYNAELRASAEAESAWTKLDNGHPRGDLDKLYAALDHWSPGTSDDTLSSAAAVAGLYRDFVEGHRAAKGAFAAGHLQEANERLALWDLAAKVVKRLQEPSSRRDEHLEEIAKLVENHPPPPFVKSARRLAQELCRDYLKPEPLDDDVLLNGGNGDEPVPRNKVTVVLKNEKSIPLSDPKDNEYTLPRDQIDYFKLPMGETRNLPEDKNIAPIKGTKYSDAVLAFNTERNQIKQWSDTSLRKLRDICEAHKEDLVRSVDPKAGGRTLIDRIDRLLKVVQQHPNLFVAPEP